MSLHEFYLWTPYEVAPRTIECDLTPGESDASLGRGSLQWAARVARDLGLGDAPVGWSLLPMRTNFCSDFVEEPDWKDRWRRAWVLRLEFAGEVHAPGPERWEPYPIDAPDPDSPYGYKDPAHDRSALVAAVFAGESGGHDLADDVSQWLRRQSERPLDLRVSVNGAGDIWQLRLLLKDIELPADVPLLDGVRDHLKALGGAISWNHVTGLVQRRSAERVVLPSPLGLKEVPSEEELKRLLATQYPGLISAQTGGEKLAYEYSSLTAEQRALLARRVAGLILDPDVAVRTAAIRFFQVQPDAPDDGALSRALASRSPLLANVKPQPPGVGDLLLEAARALSLKAKAGDAEALETLRREALTEGRAAPVILPLFMVDSEWLFDNAAAVIAGTPDAAPALFGYMVRKSADLRPVVSSLRGRVSREVVEHALEQADAPSREQLLEAFRQESPDAS
ncbi:MAG TPA: hypothetical protein VF297_26830 [Pyrinomonadaceae bacterium]